MKYKELEKKNQKQKPSHSKVTNFLPEDKNLFPIKENKQATRHENQILQKQKREIKNTN